MNKSIFVALCAVSFFAANLAFAQEKRVMGLENYELALPGEKLDFPLSKHLSISYVGSDGKTSISLVTSGVVSKKAPYTIIQYSFDKVLCIDRLMLNRVPLKFYQEGRGEIDPRTGNYTEESLPSTYQLYPRSSKVSWGKRFARTPIIRIFTLPTLLTNKPGRDKNVFTFYGRIGFDRFSRISPDLCLHSSHVMPNQQNVPSMMWGGSVQVAEYPFFEGHSPQRIFHYGLAFPKR